MRIKMKRFLGILLTLTLMLGLMPGMSSTVYASTLNSESTTWSENSDIVDNVTINKNVTVDADITLTIPAGKTLTINGQSDYDSIAVINDNSHTLTVSGGGTLIVNAPAEDEYHPRVPGIYGNLIVDGTTVQVTGGADGVYGNVTVKSGSVYVNGGNGKAGGNGYSGISGVVIVNGGSITVVGGNGGNGDTGNTGDGGSGGYGVGDVIVNGGSATITGGNGGTKSNNYASNGYLGQAVYGSITGNAKESEDNINWTSVTGSASQKQYIKFVPILVTGVSLDKTTAQTIDVDGKVFFTATVTPENASDKTVKWSVGGTNADAVTLYSDEACETPVTLDTATENLTVYAKGISAGSATVTCTSNADNTKSSSCNVTVNAAAIEPVSYMEASVDGTTHAVTFTDKSCTDYTVVDSNTTTWGTAGTTSWYVVNSDVTIDSAITFTGDVHLILCDGVTLTVNNNVKKSEDTNTANLTIYGQDAGTGALNVTSNGTSAINNNYTDTSNYNNSGGNIKINGGKITASATGTNGHGIYATGDITINGGEVNAEAIAQSNAGIWASGGIVTINGGKITAKVTNGESYGTGILGSGVIISDGEVIAVGNYKAIDCYVKNEIAGTGWTNTEGTEGKADIEISETGQDLSSYKNVQFPSDIAVTGVTLDKTTAQTVTVGDAVSFNATVSPDNASDKTVKWSVGGTNASAVTLYSDEACTTAVGTDATSILTVYAKGISAGSAIITATSNADSTKSASVTVAITENTEEGKATFKNEDASSGIKGVETEAIREQMQKIAEDDQTDFATGQTKKVTVTMDSKTVSEDKVPRDEKTAITDEMKNIIPDSYSDQVQSDFLDISVEKIVIVYEAGENGNPPAGETIQTKLTELPNVVDIPVQYNMTNKHNPKIVRYHNGAAQTFKKLSAAPEKTALEDATFYIEGAGENAVIHIYTKYFSTYALLTYGEEELKDMAKVVTPPTARTLTDTGYAQKLVTAGTTEDGTMQYALGKNAVTVPEATAFSTSIPTGKDVGTYYVWYKVKADSDHTDSNAFCVKVTISPKTVEPDIPVETEKTVPMYRLFNKGTLEHLYTDSKRERDVLSGSGWIYEGIAWYAPEKSKTPVYRLYNPILKDHHYTNDAHERDVLSTKHGWIYEGIGWYSDDAKTLPIYRRFYPFITSGSHHYTNSLNEAKHLVKVGWIDEGIGWYGAAEK